MSSLNESMQAENTPKQDANETANYFLLGGSKLKKNDSQETISQSDSVFRNPNSIESFTAPSPAGSLIEQFDTAATTPLSVDESSDTNNQESYSSSQNFFQVNSKLSQALDSNNPNFRFRRHSSQSSINLPLNLQINNNNSSTNNLASPLTLTGSFSNLSSSLNSNFTNPERVCSSPINSLKMSSRVCQIKIDEGIEPHLSREIKSERETQNTLKLKSSCDELMINSDDLGLEGFGYEREQNRTNSPNFLNSSNSSSTFKRYRTFSESQNNPNSNGNMQHGNMPSPSLSSCQSYSNSSSPTGFILNNNSNNNNNNNPNPSNPGLLRCFSPSTTLTNQSQSQLNQNYFSQSPSPTRKLFVTRRSMSPVPCSIRPSSFNPSNLVNNKRKISDVEQTDLNSPVSSSFHSPKRSLIEQEFVQPLLIFTGNSNASKTLNRSTTSSPSPSLANQVPLSPSASLSDKSSSGKLKKSDDDTNKYTFVPIQLPPPASSPGPNIIINHPTNYIQHKRLSVLTSNQLSSSQQINQSQALQNSPTNYLCDSPVSYSPSVSSNVSTSINGDKPDSGYQSSAQNNSDSESCT